MCRSRKVCNVWGICVLPRHGKITLRSYGGVVCLRSVLVLRCQAARDGVAAPSVEQQRHVCVVCGLPARERCGRCKNAVYCAREHQQLHWSHGHKSACQPSSTAGTTTTLTVPTPLSVDTCVEAGVLFPEALIVSEPEPTVAERTAFHERTLTTGTTGPKKVDSDSAALADAMDKEEDTLTEHLDQEAVAFNTRTSVEPEQCVRYGMGGAMKCSRVLDVVAFVVCLNSLTN